MEKWRGALYRRVFERGVAVGSFRVTRIECGDWWNRVISAHFSEEIHLSIQEFFTKKEGVIHRIGTMNNEQ